LLEHDTGIARGMRAIAALVCVGSIIVAIWSALQFSRDQRVVEGADAATLPSK